MGIPEVPQQISLRELTPDESSQIAFSQFQKLIKLRREHAEGLNKKGLDLVDRCLAGAFYQCRTSGQEDKAREILNSPQLVPEFLK